MNKGTIISIKARQSACLLSLAVLGCLLLPAQAQFAQPLVAGGPAPGFAGKASGSAGYGDPANGFTTQDTPLIQSAPNTPAYQQAEQGPPPAPGDGPMPPPVTAGNTAGYQPPPSRPLPGGTGNLFWPGAGQSRTTIYIHSPGRWGRGGDRMVQTLRLDTLTGKQKAEIAGILGPGVNFNSGEAAVNVTASAGQLQQIQDILYPYPGSQNVNGWKLINSDQPAANAAIYKQGNKSLYTYQGPLPTVRTFARYLVITGVVAATIWMAMAAYSVVMGSAYGGARVVSAAAGLMLLLGAYTIWKIVQMNTFNDLNYMPAVNNSKAGGSAVPIGNMSLPDVPATPGGGRPAPGRMGIPLVPLGASINR